MDEITQQQLQGVDARRQVQDGFGLALAEVEVIPISDDRQVDRWDIGIHQQVVMAGILVLNTCGRDSHVLQAEADTDRV